MKKCIIIGINHNLFLKNLQSLKANFGTLPVFLTAISTILGAVMFLRFGYAVGEVGFIGTLLIIILIVYQFVYFLITLDPCVF